MLCIRLIILSISWVSYMIFFRNKMMGIKKKEGSFEITTTLPFP